MASPLSMPVVIECPHCGTRYQLPPEAIGPRGRQVACAHCGQTWQAEGVSLLAAEPDRIFDEAEEQALDDAFVAAERRSARLVSDTTADIADIRAAIAPKPKQAERRPDLAGDRIRQQAFDRRQRMRSRHSPLARFRRHSRLAGVTALLLLLVCGVAFRADIVRQFPDLAGVYQAIGLGVNIVGLEFRDVKTLVVLRGGTRAMRVDARINSVAGRETAVPAVVVTLLDDAGAPLYEWSVAPPARSLLPGEAVEFTTQLNAPPPGATRVRLTFINSQALAEASIAASETTGS